MTHQRIASVVLALMLAFPAAKGDPGRDTVAAHVQSSPAAPICHAEASVAESASAVDFEAARAAVSAAAQRGDRAALEQACDVWRRLSIPATFDRSAWLRWHADVAMALMWQRRLDEARQVAEWGYAAMERLDAQVHQDSGYLASLLALIWMQRGNQDEAITWSERGLVHQQHPLANTNPKTLLTAKINHATFLARARRHSEAVAHFDRVLLEARNASPPEYEVAATALRGLGLIHHRHGDAAQALEFSRQEIALRKDKLPTESMQLGAALQNEAVYLVQLAQFAAAQHSLKQAIELQAKGGVDLWGSQAATLETLSGLQNERGDTQAALQSALQAVALIKTNGADQGRAPRLALALRRVAAAQLSSGDLPGALLTAREAVASFDALPPATDLGAEWVVREIHARVQLQLGAPLQALQDVDRARARASGRTLSPQERASMLLVVAGANQQLGRDASAKSALQQAYALLQEARMPADNPIRSTIAADLCALDGTGCEELLNGIEAGRDWVPAEEVRVYLGMARHRARTAQERLDSTAKATWAAQASGRPALVWWSYGDYAQVLADADRDVEAVFFAKKAIALLQQQRAQVSQALGAAAEGAYMSDKEQPYRLAAQILARQGRIAESLSVLRMLRRQELDDFVERGSSSAVLDGAALTRAEERLNSVLDVVLQ